jgi:hypothetical protein
MFKKFLYCLESYIYGRFAISPGDSLPQSLENEDVGAGCCFKF